MRPVRTHVRQIGLPRRARVQADESGIPRIVNSRRVTQVRDEWRVDEGWWSGHRTRRRYFDLVLEDGRNAAVFCDGTGEWYGQRV